MPSTRQVERSIATAEELDSVVGTMKGLAAVSLRQYERAEEALESYVGTIEKGFQIVLRAGIPLSSPPPREGPLGVVLSGTEQGLCGPLDRRLLEHAGEWLAREGVDGEDRRILGVGTRLADELHAYGLDAERTMRHPSAVEGVSGRVQELLIHLEGWREEGVDEVVVIHHRRTGRSGSEPAVRRVMPLDPALLEDLAERPWGTHVLPRTADDPARVFAALTRQMLFARLYRAFVESLASEHAGRLAAMRGAEENVESRLDELRTEFRRQRQSAITAELLEVLSGYEALSEDARDR